MSDRPIAFLTGSDSDLPSLEGAFEVLDRLEIGYHVRVLSAHRTPEEACGFARDAKSNGVIRIDQFHSHWLALSRSFGTSGLSILPRRRFLGTGDLHCT